MDTVTITLNDGSTIKVPQAIATHQPYWWKDRDHVLVFDLNPDMDIHVYTDSLPVDNYAEGNIQDLYEDYTNFGQCVWSDGEIKHFVNAFAAEYDVEDLREADRWAKGGMNLSGYIHDAPASHAGSVNAMPPPGDHGVPPVAVGYIDRHLHERICVLSRGTDKVHAPGAISPYGRIELAAELIKARQGRVALGKSEHPGMEAEIAALKEYMKEAISNDYSILQSDNTSPVIAKEKDTSRQQPVSWDR